MAVGASDVPNRKHLSLRGSAKKCAVSVARTRSFKRWMVMVMIPGEWQATSRASSSVDCDLAMRVSSCDSYAVPDVDPCVPPHVGRVNRIESHVMQLAAVHRPEIEHRGPCHTPLDEPGAQPTRHGA